MKLIDLTCPVCGATMQVNPELKMTTCNYCGNQLMIDDEVKHTVIENVDDVGVAVEKARREAEDKHYNDLISKLSVISNKAKILEQYETEEMLLLQKREEAEKKFSFGIGSVANAKVTSGKGCLGCLGVYVIFSILAGFIGGARSDGHGGLALIIVAVIIAAIIVPYQILKKKTLGEIDGQLYSLRKNKDEVINEIPNIEMIPSQYRNYDAISYVYSAISSRRCDSLTKAFSLYDEDKHRRDMFEAQNRAIAMQQAQIEELSRKRR